MLHSAEKHPVGNHPGFNDPQYDNEAELSKADNEATLLAQCQKALGVYPFIAFVIIGTTELIGWNGLLNAQYDIFTTVWKVKVVPDIHTALYSIFNAIGTLFAIIFPDIFVRPFITQIGVFLTLFDASFFILLTYLNAKVAGPLMNLLGTTMGISSALIGCSAFGYANYFPHNYAGAMSAGLGFAGVITFMIWMIALYGGGKMNTAKGVRAGNISLQAAAIIMSIVSFIFIYKFFKNKNVKVILNRREKEKALQMQRLKDGTATSEDLAQLDRGPKAAVLEILVTLKEIKFLTLSIFITMFVTLFIFPNIAPLAWRSTDSTWKNILIGTYQIGDLLGRYLPNLIPILMIQESGIYIMTGVRCLLIIFAFLTYSYPKVGSLNNGAFLIFQILILSVTNGWIMTTAMACMPTKVHTAVAKARCGSIALLALVFGIAGGQWTCAFVKLFSHKMIHK